MSNWNVNMDNYYPSSSRTWNYGDSNHYNAQSASSHYHRRDVTSSSSSSQSNNNFTQNSSVPDISKSKLTATAKEFKPNSSYHHLKSDEGNTVDKGAIRKTETKQYNEGNSNDNNRKKLSNHNNKQHWPNSSMERFQMGYRDKDKYYRNFKASRSNNRKHDEKVFDDDDEGPSSNYMKSEQLKQTNDTRVVKDNTYRNNKSRKIYHKDSRSFSKDTSKADTTIISNWRSANFKGDGGSKSHRANTNNNAYKSGKSTETSSQRDRLESMIVRNALECLVCYETIRRTHSIWSCTQCYHIFHLACIGKWCDASKTNTANNTALASNEDNNPQLVYTTLNDASTTTTTSTSTTGYDWRCPACQNVTQAVPRDYRCFCGKTTDPPRDTHNLPHTCGDACGKPMKRCEHTCPLRCHPGPCPDDCERVVRKPCGCGATVAQVRCGSRVAVTCGNVECGRSLDCGRHRCRDACHEGPCSKCIVTLKQRCHCGRGERVVDCKDVDGEIVAESVKDEGIIKDKVNKEDPNFTGKAAEQMVDEKDEELLMKDNDVQGLEGKEIVEDPEELMMALKRYECDAICDNPLPCGNHRCERRCHDGDCGKCPTDINVVRTCPCGRQPVANRRTCLDPIECCDQVCDKLLACGQSHRCRNTCHTGPCPQCPLIVTVRCRCGQMNRGIACADSKDVRCEKRCTKKRECGKHKCNRTCCTAIDDHRCPLPCNRTLTCGRHRCDAECHRGQCAPCWRTGFDELRCTCGTSVIYPPVACGTRPPTCDRPCSRVRTCGHPPHHTCHSGPCPPCTVLCERSCYGGHERRSTIACDRDGFGCGRACGKPIACTRHLCIAPCHTGPCPTVSADRCVQPCTVPRNDCGHPCDRPCHEPPCPTNACRRAVKVTCECGLRVESRSCSEALAEYRRVALLAKVADDVRRRNNDETTTIIIGAANDSDATSSDVHNKQQSSSSPRSDYKLLPCTEECRVRERNRRLAIGLQIRNPDLSQKLAPRYSDTMRDFAKKNPRFARDIHDRLTELVRSAQTDKNRKSRSLSFESMNRDKRRFVHEYCERFGCESAAYDREPNRNVVATAFKDRSWLPAMSVLEVLEREMGHRKVPGPVNVGYGIGGNGSKTLINSNDKGLERLTIRDREAGSINLSARATETQTLAKKRADEYVQMNAGGESLMNKGKWSLVGGWKAEPLTNRETGTVVSSGTGARSRFDGSSKSVGPATMVSGWRAESLIDGAKRSSGSWTKTLNGQEAFTSSALRTPTVAQKDDDYVDYFNDPPTHY